MTTPSKADGWRQCAVGQHTSQFCGQLEVEKAKAYAKGAEAMRERAADACEIESVTLATRDQTRGALYVASKVRALPIPVSPDTFTTTNTEGEQG